MSESAMKGAGWGVGAWEEEERDRGELKYQCCLERWGRGMKVEKAGSGTKS